MTAPAKSAQARSKNPDYSTLSVYIPKALHKSVKQAAIARDVELSATVEALLRTWLKKPSGPLAR